MNEPSQIIYPTLTLFLYDLREGLGQDAREVDRNRHRFWRKIEPELDKPYSQLSDGDRDRLEQLLAREKPDAPYLELFSDAPDRRKPLNVELDGYYYALQLGDVYALQTNCSGVWKAEGKPNYTLQPIDSLQDLEKEIVGTLNHQRGDRELPPEKQGTIGQTWLLWGKLPGNHPESSQVAKECAAQLAPHHTRAIEELGPGKFAGATIYELWRAPTDWQNLGRENDHLLICLFPPRQSMEEICATMEQLYPHLIRLFCFRNKILWAYSQSRQLKAQLKADYINAEAIANQLPARLKENLDLAQLRFTLADTLELLARYAKCLNYLDDKRRIIHANLINYQKRLHAIAELDDDSHLEFLEQFCNLAADRYRVQIETEYANLSLGLTLLENTIGMLRGTIDTCPSDPQPNPIPAIAAAGAGIAVTQASIAIATRGLPANPETPIWMLSLLWLGSSLLAGAMAAAIAYGWVRRP